MHSGYKFAFWIFSFFLWLYIILRAIYSPFVFDEATTFLLYVHNNKIIPGHAFWSANNHVLNTALTWVSYHLLGPEEWQLRLPNVLAFPAFCFFLYKISLKLMRQSSRLLLVLGVFSGHVFLEMFGFSRGYGLSFAALAGTVYFGLNTLKQDERKDRIGLYTSNLLMLLANLTLLPISLSLSVLSVINVGVNKQPKKRIFENLLFFGLPLLMAAMLSFQLKANGELYYTSEGGFWEGTMQSVLKTYWPGSWLWQQLFFILALVVLLFLLWRNIKAKRVRHSIIFGVSLFTTPFLFYPLAKIIVGVEFPLDRAILYIPFLLVLSLAFALDSSKVKKTLNFFIVLVVLIPLMWGFGKNASFTKASGFSWNTEQIPDAFFDEVLRNEATVGGYFLRQKCWEYLNIKSKLKSNVLQISDYPGTVADYQIVNDYDRDLFTENYSTVQREESSELVLLTRKLPLKRHELISKSEALLLQNKPGFTKLLEVHLDTINKPLGIVFSGSMKSEEDPFNGLLAISILDKNRKQLLYEEIRLRNLYLNYKESKKFVQFMYFPNEEAAKILNVLFWNKDDQNFDCTNFEAAVYSLKEQE